MGRIAELWQVQKSEQKEWENGPFHPEETTDMKKKLWLKIIFQLLITPWTCPLCMELTNLALASISFAVQMNNECENTAGDEITSADCVGKIGINSLELFCNINLKYSQVSGCFWASKKKTGVQYNSTFQTSYNESRVKQF